MDRTLTKLSMVVVLSGALGLSQVMFPACAQAGTLTAKDNTRAKQARQLYKEGQYEDAAKIFSSLSIDYPEKLVFTRNLGACYYHLRRPEPAISNLREYLRRSQEIEAEDRGEVEGWIAEMEKLRDQAIAPPIPAPAVQAAPAPTPVPAPAPVAVAPTPATPPAATSATSLTFVPEAPAENTTARPLYKTWWLWTGIGVAVAAGTVTAILLANRSSNTPCTGVSPNCVEVKGP